MKDTDSTAFSILDDNQVKHVFYDESHAILIMEGAYKDGAWADVSEPAKRNERDLREALEKRGFHVMVWRDLSGADLRTALTEAFNNYGYRRNTRLFYLRSSHRNLPTPCLGSISHHAFEVRLHSRVVCSSGVSGELLREPIVQAIAPYCGWSER